MKVLMFALSLLALPAAADDAWVEIARDKGVKIEKKAEWLRATKVFKIPYEDMRSTFLLLDFKRWVASLSTWEISDRDDDARVAFAYGRHKFPWPLSDRDYSIKMWWSETDDVLTLRSKLVDRVPEKKGVVRMRALDDVWYLKRGKRPGTSVIVYLYRADLGGSVPAFLVEEGIKHEVPSTFEGLRKDAQSRALKARKP